MALSAKRRKRLPASAFVYPSRRAYPIDTKARARNALARAAQSHTRGTYATVERAVNRRYPSIKTRKKRAAGRSRRRSRGRTRRRR